MLSEQAQTYLKRQNRDKNYYTDFEQTIEYLLLQNFDVPQVIYDIQENYGGYQLKVSGKRGAGFDIQIIAKRNIKNNIPLRHDEFEGNLYFSFGFHNTAQYTYYISSEGTICTWGPETDGIVNPVSTSTEKYIENYALMDNIYQCGTVNNYYYHVPDIKNLRDYLGKHFKRLNYCSDKYTAWYQREGLYVNTGVWLGTPQFYLTCYNKGEKTVNDFLKSLAEKKLIDG